MKHLKGLCLLILLAGGAQAQEQAHSRETMLLLLNGALEAVDKAEVVGDEENSQRARWTARQTIGGLLQQVEGNHQTANRVFFRGKEGLAVTYIAGEKADPLCVGDGDSYEKLFVIALVAENCPFSRDEVEERMHVERARFRLEPAEKWSSGYIQTTADCIDIRTKAKKRLGWVTTIQTEWMFPIGTQAVGITLDGTMVQSSEQTPKDYPLRVTGEVTANGLARYVDANIACASRATAKP